MDSIIGDSKVSVNGKKVTKALNQSKYQCGLKEDKRVASNKVRAIQCSICDSRW